MLRLRKQMNQEKLIRGPPVLSTRRVSLHVTMLVIGWSFLCE